MAARYDFREVPSKKENGEEPKLYPHIISSGTIRTRTILEEISEASTFTVGDLEGVPDRENLQISGGRIPCGVGQDRLFLGKPEGNASGER